jgi:ADP-heptose:LPS heptosyltransferase
MPAKITLLDAFRLGDLVYTGALAATIRTVLPKDTQIQVVLSKAGAELPIWTDLDVTPRVARFPWLESQFSLGSWLALLKSCRALRKYTRGTEGWDVRGDPRHYLVLRLLGCRPIRSVPPNRASKYWWKGEHLAHLAEVRQRFLDTHFPSISPRLKWPYCQPVWRRPDQPVLLIAPEASNPLRELPANTVDRLATLARSNGWTAFQIRTKPLPPDNSTTPIWRGSLADLSQRLATASAVVAVDSFTGHFAAAHGTPVVSLFGPALPEHVAPWGSRVIRLDPVGDYPCRPCRQTHCIHPALRKGPSVCMASFSAELLWEAVQQQTMLIEPSG